MTKIKSMLLIVFLMMLSSLTHAKTFSATLCKNPQFNCYTAKRGDSWEKLYKDLETRNLIMKLNRVNVSVYPGMRIATPKDMDDFTLMSISPFSNQIETSGEKTIIVSLKDLAWGAYNSDGHLESWGPISGGKGWCPDLGRGCHTVIGVFKIYRKEGANCVSSKFPIPRGGAPMPYCMYFYGGYALHGSWLPGYNASHGCVRLFENDAQWLNQEFLSNGQTAIVIIKQS